MCQCHQLLGHLQALHSVEDCCLTAGQPAQQHVPCGLEAPANFWLDQQRSEFVVNIFRPLRLITHAAGLPGLHHARAATLNAPLGGSDIGITVVHDIGLVDVLHNERRQDYEALPALSNCSSIFVGWQKSLPAACSNIAPCLLNNVQGNIKEIAMTGTSAAF